MPPLTGACKRCHMRKVKCNQATPSCLSCIDANVPCLPHRRMRRIAAQRDSEELQRRLTWLEQSLFCHAHLDVKSIKTGADLGLYLRNISCPQEIGLNIGPLSISPSDVPEIGNTGPPSATSATMLDAQQSSSSLKDNTDIAIDTAPDISLLTLNASGELRYLGPSSGSFFADYASSLARILVRKDGSDIVKSLPQCTPLGEDSRVQAAETASTPALTPPIALSLLDCYFRWVHSLFPVLGVSDRQLILDPLCDPARQAAFATSGDYLQQVYLTIFYLCLALGAAHMTSSWNSIIAMDSAHQHGQASMDRAIAADQLFIKAMEIMDHVPQMEKPSIPFIQILLLICIYGGYRPSGRGQWQLSGRALRNAVEMGLHRQGNSWKFTADEVDLRRRVFWTTYVIELTAAFNLGRPPSISDEHIDAPFPIETPETAMALHHIRHRQTQSKILAKIYCSPNTLSVLDEEQKHQILCDIQSDLDTWASNLPEIYARSQTPYPLRYWERLYHSTTAAVHRPSPLFPTQSLESVSLCLRSAGRYIECHYDLLKTGKVPQSWMLVQGMLLAGLTMIVTTKINRSLFPDRIGCSVLDIIEWSRKCSVVLNIMSERWADKIIAASESKFSLVANHTLEQLLNPNASTSTTIPNDEISQSRGPIGIGDVNFDELPSPVPGANPESQVWTGRETEQPRALVQYGNNTNINDMHFGTNLVPSNNLNDRLSDPDPFSLDGIFGGDDLFSFWDIFPDSSEISYPAIS